MQKISLDTLKQNVIEFLAELVVDRGIIGDKKYRQQLEENMDIKIDGVIKNDLFIAEIFVAQIPLAIYLEKNGLLDLMDYYYFELSRSIGEKEQLTPEILYIFMGFLKARYAEYHAIIKSEGSSVGAIKILAQKISPLILKNPNPIFEVGLTNDLVKMFAMANDFVEAVKNNWELISDKT